MSLVINILTMFATSFLVPFFLFAGSIKVFRWHAYMPAFQLGFMESYGLNATIYTIIGIFELAGALGLILQGNHVLGTLAAGGIILLALGAFSFHLKFDSFSFGMPALITAVLSALVFFSNFEMLAGLPDNLALSLKTISFSFKISNIIPAAIGVTFALIFSRMMLVMATNEMTKNANSETL